jgi:TM2 domain-containing membrane protein YozV
MFPWFTSTIVVRGTKSTFVAYFLLCFSFILICGLHHFYLGHIFRGLIWLFTFGLFGIGIIYDIFTLPSQVRRA